MGPQNMHIKLMSLSTPEATVYGSSEYAYATHEYLHPRGHCVWVRGTPPPPKNGFVFLFWKGRGVKLLLVFLGKSLPKISNNS